MDEKEIAELEKQEPVGYFYEDHTGSLRQAHDDQFFADHMPLFAAPVVSPDVEKLKAEIAELKRQLAESQAREAKLREELEINCGPVMESFAGPSRMRFYKQALELPHDDTALKEYLAAEKEKPIA